MSFRSFSLALALFFAAALLLRAQSSPTATPTESEETQYDAWLNEQGGSLPKDLHDAKAVDFHVFAVLPPCLNPKEVAAQNGDALNDLGRLYQHGCGVDQDFEQAMKWYQKAAATGNAKAMKHIGFFYQNGYGVPKDSDQADLWYRKAAMAAGVDEAVIYEKIGP